VSRNQQFDKPPVRVSWSQDFKSGEGAKATFAEVVKQVAMVDGGKWVWQPDKPLPRAPMRGRPQRGRGAGGLPQGQVRANQPPPPPHPLQKQGAGGGAGSGQANQQKVQVRQPQDKAAHPSHQVKSSTSVVEIDPRYRKLTCYNCGEPGHFIGICEKPKICFICAIPGHNMSDCPSWKKPQLMAAFLGNVGSGLGFYHIELPDVETTRWLNISNCGVVNIKRGQITLAELEQELSEIFCKKWPWQIRELTHAKFLERSPPP
jgi:hypothetical protein